MVSSAPGGSVTKVITSPQQVGHPCWVNRRSSTWEHASTRRHAPHVRTRVVGRWVFGTVGPPTVGGARHPSSAPDWERPMKSSTDGGTKSTPKPITGRPTPPALATSDPG